MASTEADLRGDLAERYEELGGLKWERANARASTIADLQDSGYTDVWAIRQRVERATGHLDAEIAKCECEVEALKVRLDGLP